MQETGLTIFTGGRTTCRAGQWGSKSEWKSEAKLYFPAKGQGWVKIGGKVTRLQAGHLYLIPPRVRTSYGTSSEIVIDWLHFLPHSLHLNGRLGSLTEIQLFGQSVIARFKSVCRSIDRFMREPSIHDTLRIHAMLLELIGLTLLRLPREDPQTRLAHDRFVPALRFLDEHAYEHPSLRDIARTVNLSPEHFHRLFREIFHTTPRQYAEARRMTRAQNLLSEGQASVSEVANQCGYADQFYFSRVFRRYFGVNPGQVRRGLAIIGPKP